MKLIEVTKRLRSMGLVIFTTPEFQRATGFSGTAARKFLLRYTAQGVFWQLKRGMYAFQEEGSLHPWIVANKLYSPSYVSLDSALAYYGLIPESVYGVTSVTTRITREFEACHTLFTYQTIKSKAYGGYLPVSLEGKTIFVAELEKAVADTLYFVHLGKKSLNERMAWGKINRKKLIDHLKLFDRKNLTSWSQHVIANSH